jgi:hypothetical protein
VEQTLLSLSFFILFFYFLNQTSVDIFHVAANNDALSPEERSSGSASGYAEIIGPMVAIIVIGAILYCTGCRKRNKNFRLGDNNSNVGNVYNGNYYNGSNNNSNNNNSNNNFYYPPVHNTNNNSNMPINMPITVPIYNTNNVNV